ncbi:MAG TPA: DUF6306 domain-containing protein [Methylovirgula sp.]|jgi:hypothetical protein
MTSASDDKPIVTASPACLMHEADESYMGYFDAAELIVFLNGLLEDVRASGRVVNAIARKTKEASAAAIHTDDMQACALLGQHIARLSGVASGKTGSLYEEAMAVAELRERLLVLARGRSALARRMAEALPRVRDDRLRADLAGMLRGLEADILC